MWKPSCGIFIQIYTHMHRSGISDIIWIQLQSLALYSGSAAVSDCRNTDLGVESGASKDAALHSPTLPLVTPANTDVTWHSSLHITEEDLPRPGVSVITSRFSGERYHHNPHIRLCHEHPSTLASTKRYLALPPIRRWEKVVRRRRAGLRPRKARLARLSHAPHLTKMGPPLSLGQR